MNEHVEAVLIAVCLSWMAVHPMLAHWGSKPKRIARITFRVGHQPGGAK